MTKEKKKQYKYQKSNKTKPLTVFILCKNMQVKEFNIYSTRKFNLEDETYVIKENCCYLQKTESGVRLISLYNQGNPNPISLKKDFKNTGLTEQELDDYIGADIFNIIVECQKNDRSKYVLGFVCFLFLFALINFLTIFFK